MGNNNTTAGLTEEETSKLETNGLSPLESVSVQTTQDQVFLAEESSKLETNGMSQLESVSVRSTQDKVFLASESKGGDHEIESLPDGKETPETEPQSKELVEEDSIVKKVEEEMHQNGLESLIMETEEKLQKQAAVAEVEELSMIGIQSVVSELITKKFGNEEKPSVIDEAVFVSPSFYETVGTEDEEVINGKSVEEIALVEEVIKLDQETDMEHRIGFPEIKPREILNLDDDEVTNEGKAGHAICEPGLQESNAIQQTGLEVYKEEKDMESEREASLKRMSRCRSLPVSHNSKVMGDSLVQQLVSEVAFPSRNKMGLEKPNKSETLLVSCVGSNKTRESSEAITESDKESRLELRSPSFGSDLRIEERKDESTEKTPLFCEDKSEIYEATIDVEEKTVMLKRSESEQTRGFELSLGLSMKPSERSEADDSFEEIKGSGDNLLDKKASLGSMKGRVRKRSISSLLGTCLCCNVAMK